MDKYSLFQNHYTLNLNQYSSTETVQHDAQTYLFQHLFIYNMLHVQLHFVFLLHKFAFIKLRLDV